MLQANELAHALQTCEVNVHGRAVVGQNDFSGPSLNHLVHALGSEGRANGIGHGARGRDVVSPHLCWLFFVLGR